MGRGKFVPAPNAKKRRKEQVEAELLAQESYAYYYDRLTELAISMFEWVGLPPEIDVVYLERSLYENGHVVFFRDAEADAYAVMKATLSGQPDIYGIPTERQVYAINGYHATLYPENSVIVFNNSLRGPTSPVIDMFARKMADMSRTIDVNLNAQRTPVLVRCSEKQRLTLKNMYEQYSGNAPVIFGDAETLDPKGIQTFSTGAPYVADKVYQLTTQRWNEAMTYLGISNVNTSKKERMITDEVLRNMGSTVASRYSRLEARRRACRQINALFGLNVSCNYREDFELYDDEAASPTTEGADVEAGGGE
jgi:hypothetical protein